MSLKIPNTAVLVNVFDCYMAYPMGIRDTLTTFSFVEHFSQLLAEKADQLSHITDPYPPARESFEFVAEYVRIAERVEVKDGKSFYPCLDTWEHQNAAEIGWHGWLYLCGWTAEEFYDEADKRLYRPQPSTKT